MEELNCFRCQCRIGWMIYAGPYGLVYCDDCKDLEDAEEAEQQSGNQRVGPSYDRNKEDQP